MAREPKKRDSYRGDAVKVNVVIRAIELDGRCSPEWRKQAVEAGNELIRLLMLDHTKAPPMVQQPSNPDIRKAG
jgi:hypothetical protein